MSSHCLERTLVALLFTLAAACAAAEGRELRVCADPDNLPYSRQDGSGFENRIAELLARELDAHLTYQWMPQRRGFVRRTLNARVCDVIVGVPRDFDAVRTTAPYYRSMYMFVYRDAAGPAFRDFDDPRLKTARIGVQLVGDEATPPGHALASRGLTDNVVGFTVYGERPQAQRMVEAVAKGEIDIAVIWGPQAAYFARQQTQPLAVSAAVPPADRVRLPYAYDISLGVRRQDAALQRELDEVMARRRDEVDAILREYGVPRAEAPDRAARAGR